MLNNETVQQQITEKFGSQVYGFEAPYGMLTFEADRDSNIKILQYLKDDLGFTFLNDLTAVHYPDNIGKELAVVYMLQNIQHSLRIRFKVYTDITKPDVFTATKVFETSNWLEREAYDFYGVNFVGHPNLIRIMNVEDMDYHPLRKEYPLEDQSRIDKDDNMFGR